VRRHPYIWTGLGETERASNSPIHETTSVHRTATLENTASVHRSTAPLQEARMHANQFKQVDTHYSAAIEVPALIGTYYSSCLAESN